MKTTRGKKLRLGSETLRSLSPAELGDAAGGTQLALYPRIVIRPLSFADCPSGWCPVLTSLINPLR